MSAPEVAPEVTKPEETVAPAATEPTTETPAPEVKVEEPAVPTVTVCRFFYILVADQI